jgi:hypothetical protein
MQTIKFLRNFFTKGIEIHSSFYHIFLVFFSKEIKFKIFKIGNFQIFDFFKISNLKIEKSPNFEFKKSSNFGPVPKR